MNKKVLCTGHLYWDIKLLSQKVIFRTSLWFFFFFFNVSLNVAICFTYLWMFKREKNKIWLIFKVMLKSNIRIIWWKILTNVTQKVVPNLKETDYPQKLKMQFEIHFNNFSASSSFCLLTAADSGTQSRNTRESSNNLMNGAYILYIPT